MVISEVTTQDVLAGCRQVLGLPESSDATLDDTLLAALSRRSAGILCPCSRTTLRTALLESLQGLGNDEAAMPDRIDAVLEGLTVGGDLLELNDVATVDPAVKGTWVFAAPPSFVISHGGSIFLAGTVPDQDTFLPPSLASRILHRGITRIIEPLTGEDLAGELRDQGLQELSESVWLKTPKAEAADEMLSSMERRLAAMPPSGTIGNLEILDPARPVRYYRGRWVSPAQKHSGSFVARRPQDYGAPIWCFVTLERGVPVRLLDLPLKKTRWRGCDVAWHLQMAIDRCRAAPQLYRRLPGGNEVRFDFFSPLPQWSQRRLMIFGRPAPREGSLISYWLPADIAEHEERFLQERLWFTPINDSV